MALITISGFPSSGKSTRAAQIQNFLLKKDPLLNVIIISDHSLGLFPSEYSQSSSEKSARATLFTAVQRHMAVGTILIVDSLNYIKGFRYQLYCAARELKLRTCTVRNHFSPYHQNHQTTKRCLSSQVQIYAENGMRLGKRTVCTTQPRTSIPYSSHLPYSHLLYSLENLIVRFEEPSSMVRWDAPLFTVLWNDEEVPGIQIWEAITHGSLKPPNSGTLAVSFQSSSSFDVNENGLGGKGSSRRAKYPRKDHKCDNFDYCLKFISIKRWIHPYFHWSEGQTMYHTSPTQYHSVRVTTT